MTLELTPSTSRYQYRISPSDKCSIQRRRNEHGARWEYYTTCQTAQDARRALLAMQACPVRNGEGKEVPK